MNYKFCLFLSKNVCKIYTCCLHVKENVFHKYLTMYTLYCSLKILTPLTKIALNIVLTHKIVFSEFNSKNKEIIDYNGITSQTCCIKLYKRMCVKTTKVRLGN